MTTAKPKPKHRDDALVVCSSINAPVRRSAVAAKAHFADYQEELRWDFWFHCAYCTISEFEASTIGFSIDHYLPQSRYPELINEYGNLLWSCDTCNSYKGAGPSKNAALKGHRFVRPDADDPDEHIVLSRKSRLRVEHKTVDIGEYTVERLYLNREALRRLRFARSRIARSADIIRRGLTALRGQPIQDLPVKARARFLEVRRRVCARAEAGATIVDDELLRAANRSELKTPPSTCNRDAMRRIEYLRRVDSPVPALRTDG